MKIKQVYKLIDEVEIGDIFYHDSDIWIKTNASHNNAGYQCVQLNFGNLMYVKKGTKVTEVKAELLVITPIPKDCQLGQ